MNAEPWKKWTPEEVRRWAGVVSRAGSEVGSKMLEAFAALLETMNATALERCEAILRAVGKWVDL